MNQSAPQDGTKVRSLCGWGGLVALSVGTASFAGVSGIGRYRTQAIIDNPCIKSALGKSALENWLAVAAAVCLIVAVIAFGAVLVAVARRRIAFMTSRFAWAGLAIALLLLLPAANLAVGDPLGVDDGMLPNCAAMASLSEIS